MVLGPAAVTRRDSVRFPSALCATAWLLGGAGALRAQTLDYPPAKVAEVRETNRAGDEIQYLKEWLSPDPAFYAVIGLGDHATSFGTSAAAEAWVEDDGTFWGRVNADNNNAPYQDWGNGEASTTLAYSMHKAKDVPAQVTLQMTGGKLSLTDYGGGAIPLEAGVIVEVTITPDGSTDSASDSYFAALSGRGGSETTESFDWGQQGFDLTEANYTESGHQTSIYTAELVIPAKTVTYVLDYLCEECDIVFWVELHVFAKNPGGETVAYAYFRDPVHIDDPEPELGGASITYEGVTLLPAPEPAAPAGRAAGFVAAALIAWRARDRAKRRNRTMPRATAPAA
jgi:hypothetical protein